MDDNFSPDSSAASADVASVQEPAVSAPVSEATPVDNNQIANPAEPVEASQAPASDELPDDQAFLQLDGEQRAQNWKQLRTRYAETKGKLSEYQPVFEQVQQYGGLEQMQQKAQLADLLFSPVLGHDEQPLLDANGLPQYSAAPFVDAMLQQSPSIMQEVMMTGFDAPNPLSPNETMGHWFVRERLGIDPEMIPMLQQIKSPQEAARLIAQSGGVDPAELQAIPEQFHDAYKSLTQKQREELSYADAETKAEFLQDKTDALMARQYVTQQQQRDVETRQQAAQAAQARIQETGDKYVQEAISSVVDPVRKQLEVTAAFTGDPEMDKAAHETIINRAVKVTAAAMPLENKRLDEMLRLSAQYAINGDRYSAQAAKVEADKLTQKINDAFSKEVTRQTGAWSRHFAGSRQALQQQKQNAQPRIEIGSNGNATGGEAQPFQAPPPGQRFGLGTARINELAAQLAMRKAGQG